MYHYYAWESYKMRVQLPITLDCLWAGFNLKDLRKYKEPQMTETKKHKKAIQRLR